MYDKNYYEDRKKDIVEELGKGVNRLIEDIYAFVKQRESLAQKLNDVIAKEKESNKILTPDNTPKEVLKNIKK